MKPELKKNVNFHHKSSKQRNMFVKVAPKLARSLTSSLAKHD